MECILHTNFVSIWQYSWCYISYWCFIKHNVTSKLQESITTQITSSPTYAPWLLIKPWEGCSQDKKQESLQENVNPREAQVWQKEGEKENKPDTTKHYKK